MTPRLFVPSPNQSTYRRPTQVIYWGCLKQVAGLFAFIVKADHLLNDNSGILDYLDYQYTIYLDGAQDTQDSDRSNFNKAHWLSSA